MKLALISLLLAAAPAFAADAPKAEAPKAAAAKTETPKAPAPKAEVKKAPSTPAPKDPFKSDEERSSYTIGFMQGRNFAPFKLTPSELKAVMAGLNDAVNGAQPKIDIRFYSSRVNDFLNNRMNSLANPEKEKGRAYTEKFVKEFKPREIPGGGWYLETKAGTGPIPAKTDRIKVNYRGTLVDGTEFDSSYKRNAPYEFSLTGGVIPCWLNTFPMMKVGGTAKIVCPSEVAYKFEEKPPLIKPGATLVFEVEFVEIVKP